MRPDAAVRTAVQKIGDFGFLFLRQIRFEPSLPDEALLPPVLDRQRAAAQEFRSAADLPEHGGKGDLAEIVARPVGIQTAEVHEKRFPPLFGSVPNGVRRRHKIPGVAALRDISVLKQHGKRQRKKIKHQHRERGEREHPFFHTAPSSKRYPEPITVLMQLRCFPSDLRSCLIWVSTTRGSPSKS